MANPSNPNGPYDPQPQPPSPAPGPGPATPEIPGITEPAGVPARDPGGPGPGTSEPLGVPPSGPQEIP